MARKLENEGKMLYFCENKLTMKGTRTTLIILLLLLFNSTQTIYAEIEEDNNKDFINNLEKDKSTFTLDTLKDGTIMVKIISSEHLPAYEPDRSKSHQKISLHKTRSFRNTLSGIIIIGLLIYLYIVTFGTNRKRKKAHQKYLQDLQTFKLQADKISVRLADCKIKERTYYEKINRSYRQQQNDAIDSQIFDIQRNDTKELHSCTIIYETTIDNKTAIFSSNIDKDELTLRILFGLQETTYIYIDKDNKESYYFDLDFLNR